jgi:hypothetical protein
MATKTTTKASWLDAPLATVKAVVDEIGGDGHSTWDPQRFVELGVPQPLVDRETTTIVSSKKDHKYMLFDSEGRRIAKQTCVYGLTVLEHIVWDLNIPAENSFMGRGFLARFLTERIYEYLEKSGVE